MKTKPIKETVNPAGLHLWEAKLHVQGNSLWITTEKKCSKNAVQKAVDFGKTICHAPVVEFLQYRGTIDA